MPGSLTERYTALSQTPTAAVESPTVQQLERRIVTLEAALRALRKESKEPSSHIDAVDSGERVNNRGPTISSGLFKGREHRTFFYGSTNPMFVPAHFPDLRPFMKRTFVDSTLSKLRQDVRESEERSRANQSISTRVLAISNLRSILPDRSVVDELIKTYFDTFECTYRILHAPTFWASYQSYWDPSQLHTASNSEMDAVVVAILACTLCTSTHKTTRYDMTGSTFRTQAIVWIKACEAWLGQQSHKHRSLASVQVRFLRILALSTTCLKTKQYYEEVQHLVAFLRSIGMHRDPKMWGDRCSVFEGEMRRRLWATAMELELQASIDKGKPPLLELWSNSS